MIEYVAKKYSHPRLFGLATLGTSVRPTVQGLIDGTWPNARNDAEGNAAR